MSDPIRTAVIGAGMMGRNHVRVYADLPNSQLVGVADSVDGVAVGVGRRFGCPGYVDYRQMLDDVKPQAVTIAVPTVAHLEVARECAGRGIHMLIEKPIAFTLEAGREIIALSKSQHVVLAVGHIERFNPAVIELRRRLAAGELGKVIQVEARRQSPFPARVQDVGVVIDLAVHDLDIIRHVTQQEIVRVYAETSQRLHGSREDLLLCLLRLSGGAQGSVNINWLTPTKIRELVVIGEAGLYRVDYLTQDLTFYENATAGPEWDSLQMLRGVSEGSMTRYALIKKEPLRSELEAFLDGCAGRQHASVSGLDALRALELALFVVESGSCHSVVATV